jgi:hypothetical protein
VTQGIHGKNLPLPVRKFLKTFYALGVGSVESVGVLHNFSIYESIEKVMPKAFTPYTPYTFYM